METPRYWIAGWRFDPTEPVLRSDAGDRRLEDRAARTLAELCRRRGEVVGKAELIATVWGGRAVSDNSVSIVIGNLRRALGDDPRDPLMLITVPRRGYRLTLDPASAASDDVPPIAAPRSSKRPMVCAAGFFGGLLVLAAALLLSHTANVTLRVEAPSNGTGQPELSALVSSLAPVVVDGANRLPGVRVLDDGPAHGARITLRSRLILWNGAPELALSAVDTRSGTLIWTAFASGPPALLARHVTERIRGLAHHLPS